MKEYLNLGSVQDPSFDLKDFLTSSFEKIAETHKDDPTKQKEKMLLCLFSVLNHYGFDKVVTLFEEAEKKEQELKEKDIQTFTENMLSIQRNYNDPESSHMEMDNLITNKLASLGYEEGSNIFNDTDKRYA